MAHRYRLYLEPDAETVLIRHCGDARFVWNLALEQANLWRPGRRSTPGSTQRMRQLAEARRNSWLGEGSSSVQQQALRDFDRALKHWWAKTHRRPRWRKAGINEGFCIRDVTVTKINRRWATIAVPKCAPVRFRLSRPLPADYGMARITLDRSGRWHISFAASQPVVQRETTGMHIGIDLGVVATITTSAGDQHHSPTPARSEAARLLRLQRKLSRQDKGSNRRKQTKAKIARLKARETDRRRDFIEKTTTALVVRYDTIAIEDLQVKNMVRSAKGTSENPGRNVTAKAGLNRAIHSQGWAMFRRRLVDKAATCGVTVLAVNPAHTSQRCAACGHVSPENRKSQAVFACVACEHHSNADVNAAINILAAGQAVYRRGEDIRPPLGGILDEASTTLAA